MDNTATLLGEDYRVKAERGMHEEVYKLLASPNAKDIEQMPFLTLKDTFMWAFSLGVQAGKRTPLEGPKEGIFWFYQFSKDIDLVCLKMVGLSETEDVTILVREDEIMAMAEEYANTGIRILMDKLVGQNGDPLWNLVNMVKE